MSCFRFPWHKNIEIDIPLKNKERLSVRQYFTVCIIILKASQPKFSWLNMLFLFSFQQPNRAIFFRCPDSVKSFLNFCNIPDMPGQQSKTSIFSMVHILYLVKTGQIQDNSIANVIFHPHVLAKPYPARSFTRQKAPSFPWRNNILIVKESEKIQFCRRIISWNPYFYGVKIHILLEISKS